MDLHSSILKGLSDHEALAFNAFSRVCADQGLLTRPINLNDNDVPSGLNDDATLLRFLRARSYDVDGALKQFQEATEARQSNQILQLYDKIDSTSYENARSLYPHWCGRRDKRGFPIILFDIARLDRATLTDYDKTRGKNLSINVQPKGADMEPTTLQRACVVHDNLVRFVLPLCSAMTDRPNPTVPVTSALYIADISELGLRQGWDLRSYAQDITKLLALCYPELLDRVFLLNAPSYFATIWSFIKKFVDPATAAKLVILSPTEALPTLTTFIDLDNIPTKFGGTFNFTPGMIPDLDLGIRHALDWSPSSEEELPPGPFKWSLDSTGRKVAVAVGSVDGILRVQPVAILNTSLKADVDSNADLQS